MLVTQVGAIYARNLAPQATLPPEIDGQRGRKNRRKKISLTQASQATQQLPRHNFHHMGLACSQDESSKLQDSERRVKSGRVRQAFFFHSNPTFFSIGLTLNFAQMNDTQFICLVTNHFVINEGLHERSLLLGGALGQLE